jgi:hypothetical protein
MFADLGVKWYQWIIFFLLIFLWSWIVHAAARRAVQYDDWVAEAHIGNGLSDDVRQKLQREFYWPALLSRACSASGYSDLSPSPSGGRDTVSVGRRPGL